VTPLSLVTSQTGVSAPSTSLSFSSSGTEASDRKRSLKDLLVCVCGLPRRTGALPQAQSKAALADD